MSATAAEPKRCGHNNDHRGRRRRRETREKRKRGHSFVMHPLRLRGSQARADAKTPRGQSLLLEAGAARPRHASAPRPALQETESPLLRPSVPRGRPCRRLGPLSSSARACPETRRCRTPRAPREKLESRLRLGDPRVRGPRRCCNKKRVRQEDPRDSRGSECLTHSTWPSSRSSSVCSRRRAGCASARRGRSSRKARRGRSASARAGILVVVRLGLELHARGARLHALGLGLHALGLELDQELGGTLARSL